jgi:hypothetical protein
MVFAAAPLLSAVYSAVQTFVAEGYEKLSQRCAVTVSLAPPPITFLPLEHVAVTDAALFAAVGPAPVFVTCS